MNSFGELIKTIICCGMLSTTLVLAISTNSSLLCNTAIAMQKEQDIIKKPDKISSEMWEAIKWLQKYSDVNSSNPTLSIFGNRNVVLMETKSGITAFVTGIAPRITSAQKKEIIDKGYVTEIIDALDIVVPRKEKNKTIRSQIMEYNFLLSWLKENELQRRQQRNTVGNADEKFIVKVLSNITDCMNDHEENMRNDGKRYAEACWKVIECTEINEKESRKIDNKEERNIIIEALWPDEKERDTIIKALHQNKKDTTTTSSCESLVISRNGGKIIIDDSSSNNLAEIKRKDLQIRVKNQLKKVRSDVLIKALISAATKFAKEAANSVEFDRWRRVAGIFDLTKAIDCRRRTQIKDVKRAFIHLLTEYINLICKTKYGRISNYLPHLAKVGVEKVLLKLIKYIREINNGIDGVIKSLCGTVTGDMGGLLNFGDFGKEVDITDKLESASTKTHEYPLEAAAGQWFHSEPLALIWMIQNIDEIKDLDQWVWFSQRGMCETCNHIVLSAAKNGVFKQFGGENKWIIYSEVPTDDRAKARGFPKGYDIDYHAVVLNDLSHSLSYDDMIKNHNSDDCKCSYGRGKECVVPNLFRIRIKGEEKKDKKEDKKEVEVKEKK